MAPAPGTVRRDTCSAFGPSTVTALDAGEETNTRPVTGSTSTPAAPSGRDVIAEGVMVPGTRTRTDECASFGPWVALPR
jgi:hypothetical protein